MIPHPHSSRRTLVCVAITLLAGGAALTGCQSSPTTTSSPEPAPSHDAAGWKAEYDAWRTDTVITVPDMTEEEKLRARRAELEESRPESAQGVPLPELIMWSAPGDWGPQAECMKELGYSVSVDAHGMSISAADDSDVSALDRDSWMCAAKYTIDPRSHQPYTREQYEVLYTYLTTFYLQCTEGHGVHLDRDAVPSQEQWISDLQNGNPNVWIPYDTHTWPKDVQHNPEVSEAIDRDCPPHPPLAYFLGSE